MKHNLADELTLPKPLPGTYSSAPSVFIACSHCNLPDDERNHFCLHDIAIPQLFDLRVNNCQTLVVTRGDCDTCPKSPYPESDNPRARLEDKLDHINDKLYAREMGGMMVHWLDEITWHEQHKISIEKSLVKKTAYQETSTQESRRHFFKQWLPKL